MFPLFLLIIMDDCDLVVFGLGFIPKLFLGVGWGAPFFYAANK